MQTRQTQLDGQDTLQKYQPADLLELARIYEQLGELARAASTLRVHAHLKTADAEGQRELAPISLKLNEQKGARIATGSADSMDVAQKP